MRIPLVSICFLALHLFAAVCSARPYAVALYDGNGTNGKIMSRLAAAMAEADIPARSINAAQFGDSGQFNAKIFDALVIRGDKNLTKEMYERLVAETLEGLDLVILGKVDFESIAYPEEVVVGDYDAKTRLTTSFFGDYDVYDFSNIVKVRSTTQCRDLLDGETVIEGSFSGTQGIGWPSLKESVCIPVLEAINRHGRQVGWAGTMTIHHSGPFNYCNWATFGIEQHAFYETEQFAGHLVDILQVFRRPELALELKAKEAITASQIIPVTSPPLPKLSIKEGHFVYPDGRRFFIVGANLFDSFYGFYDSEKHWDTALLEEDFKRMHQAGITALRVFDFDRFCNKDNPQRLDALIEFARRYKVYIMPCLVAHTYYFKNKTDMQAEVRRVVRRIKDENVFFAYDLDNEPYEFDLAAMQENGASLGERFPAYKAWLDYYQWGNFGPGMGRKRTSTFPGMAGKSQIPVPEEALLRQALEDVNKMFATWIDWHREAIRSVDKETPITIGYNNSLALLPTNEVLDFASQHCYEPPSDFASVMRNVTTMDRLRAFWPDKPITIGEFAYSSGDYLADWKIIDVYNQAIGETLHHLYALANDYDGAMRWQLGELPRTIQLRSQPWWIVKDKWQQARQRRFGLYYPDGTFQCRPKPIAHAMKFVSDYAAAGHFGGKLKVEKIETRLGIGYEYLHDNALMVGNVNYDAHGLSFVSQTPANVMLRWSNGTIDLVATCDVAITLNVRELTQQPDSTSCTLSGKVGSHNLGDLNNLQVVLLEGEPVSITCAE